MVKEKIVEFAKKQIRVRVEGDKQFREQCDVSEWFLDDDDIEFDDTGENFLKVTGSSNFADIFKIFDVTVTMHGENLDHKKLVKLPFHCAKAVSSAVMGFFLYGGTK